MATATLKRTRVFGPDAAGTLMTPREFDRARFEEGSRYELLRGVLVVTPIPLEGERGPNDYLGHLLYVYRENHPMGRCLDDTLYEHTIETGENRRRADRVIWAGLGRVPRRNETPTIIAEFVSGGKRDRVRDYEEKREEYEAIGVQEYWVIDRFQRTMTVFNNRPGKKKKQVIREKQTYQTDLLPGFELPLARLLAVADRWQEQEVDVD